MDWPFGDLERGKYGAILADPPWRFRTWSETNQGRAASNHYSLMHTADILALPVQKLADDNCVLFLWISWPMLPQAMSLISAWEFEYKTCAFDWMKANTQQIDMFRDDADPVMGLGYWTRANTEALFAGHTGLTQAP
jgi:N6-adenosine-specific RNA methylase IME4